MDLTAANHVLDKLYESTDRLTDLSFRGGYAGTYNTADGTQYGESEFQVLGSGEIFMQPPGTPRIGDTFLLSYRATGDEKFLDAAKEVAQSLAYAQKEIGGWNYVYKMTDRDSDYLITNSLKVTLDDDVSTGVLRFLVNLDQYVDEQWLTDSITDGYNFLATGQSAEGGWSHSYPDYGDYRSNFTYADNVQSNTIKTFIHAYQNTDPSETALRDFYLDKAKLGASFALDTQLDSTTPAWAQFYDTNLQPTSGRVFEIPGVASLESANLIKTLIELYEFDPDPRYLEVAQEVSDWLRASAIEFDSNGDPTVWTRLYEIGTNRPIYGMNSAYEHLFSQAEADAAKANGTFIEYGWIINFSIPQALLYNDLVHADPDNFYENVLHGNPFNTGLNLEELEDAAEAFANDWTATGWEENDLFDTKDFNNNSLVLQKYLWAKRQEVTEAEWDGLVAGNTRDLVAGDKPYNLVGTDGDDELLGSVLSDTISGGLGDDRMSGGVGADIMTGGLGDDHYNIDDAGDQVIEAAGEGHDTVWSTTVDIYLSDNVEEARLYASGNVNAIGNALDNVFRGNEGNNILIGGGGDDNFIADAGNDRLLGGIGDDRLNGGAGADRMEGSVGDDIYYVDNAGDRVMENADEGTDLVRSSINYTLDIALESLILMGNASAGVGNSRDNYIEGNAGIDYLTGGLGNDRLYGGVGNDRLLGGGGDDLLFGDDGIDRMEGNGGDDVYYVDNVADRVIEVAGEGIDVVNSKVNLGRTLYDNVETLVLNGVATIGIGNSLDNFLQGNGQNNILSGGLGDDRLYGKDGDDRLIGSSGNDRLFGDAGDDRMEGGTGDDIYYVDSTSDRVIEKAGEGTDVVNSSVNSSTLLYNNIETLILAGSATIGIGNSLDNHLQGNDEDNILVGGAGDDRLYGGDGDDRLIGSSGNDRLFGDAGADRMEGGTGDDLYYVDNAGDTVSERFNSGNDAVNSTVNSTGTLFNNVETLILNGTAVVGIGNSLDNLLQGNAEDNILVAGSGDDRLYGGDGDDRLLGSAGNDRLFGEAGADRMEGGTGDDLYYVDNTGDQVLENAGAGNDAVIASIDYALTSGSEIETLTLIGSARIGAGNALDNYITGTSGVNSLIGGLGDDRLYGGEGNDRLLGSGGNDRLFGEAGADEMEGGTGDDIYYVDDAGDTVIESIGAGNDAVITSIDYTLTSGSEIETLTLVGASAVIGNGNDLDNYITGNILANTLSGGLGDDRLYGGANDDILSGGGGNDRLFGDDGADHMTGGAGDDLFYVNNVGDTVVESAGEGTDAINSTIDFVLTNSSEVETLVLSGSALNGTGNDLDNLLQANAGQNTLIGGGGDDRLYGRAGNDDLFGGAGNDRLFGEEGADRMEGGTGDDLYYVDNIGDTVIEGANGGADLVRSDVDFTLSSNVESLVLTGTGNLDGTGNNTANFLYGNSGANVLDGGAGDDELEGEGGNDVLTGGTGGDILTGGSGSDRFVFKANQGADTVKDFVLGDGDRIDLVDFGFTYGQVQSRMTDLTFSTLLDLDNGNTVIIQNNLSADLTVDAFLL